MKIALVSLTFGIASPALAEVEQGRPNTDFTPTLTDQTRAPALPETTVTVEPFVQGLENPWGIATLPQGGWIVTERPGRMRLISADGAVSAPIMGLPEVAAIEQGGLLDVAIAPDFAFSRMIWWTYAKPLSNGFATAAARGVLSADGTELSEVQDMFIQDPPSLVPAHYGSRVVFDGQGHVYVTTGERFTDANRQLAQDITTTYGKVIRLTETGSVPADNPYVGVDGDDQIWSLGHRNIQGAAVDPASGLLWTIEHGPQGGDELNQPGPGLNYGWPLVSYGENYDGTPVGDGQSSMQGVQEPVYYWDPVIAPGGMLFYQGDYADWQGDVLIASLNPGALVRLKLIGGRVIGEERLLTDVGRVRDLEPLAEGGLLLLIDAADGEILRVTPQD